ncbi:hypothetical protein CRUP_016151, partial [Coryphaenoides rupestris]
VLRLRPLCPSSRPVRPAAQGGQSAAVMAAEEEEEVMYFVGVDVGTASVRAALVTREGRLSASAAEEPIGIWEPQSVTRGVDKRQVRGIGFDATCSLVVLDRNFQPVAVNQDGRGPPAQRGDVDGPPGRAPGGPHYRHRPPGPGRSGRGHVP